jgi:hypothetical protein
MPGTPAAGASNVGGVGGSPAAVPGAGGGDQGSQDGGASEMAQQTIGMLRMIDKALGNVADLFKDSGGQEVAQARELLQQGMAKWLGSVGGNPPAVSATDTGPGFPGGGYSAGAMPGT